MNVVTRFAPSPTGLLHLGHAHAALFAERTARKAGGRFLLRIEDIDRSRCRPQFEDAILDDLRWLGAYWDGPVLRQSERVPAYAEAIDRLRAMGLLYPCFCTRTAIAAEIAASVSAPHGPDGPVYPGTCRSLSEAERAGRIGAGLPFALRLDMERAAHNAPSLAFRDLGQGCIQARPEVFGDVILARKDIGTSYHLAVVVDDAFQEVTLVTRGEDLRPATHLHRLLQALLELPVPDYRHHGLIRDARGRRLAKRDHGCTLRDLREQSVRPADVRAMTGFPDATG